MVVLKQGHSWWIAHVHMTDGAIAEVKVQAMDFTHALKELKARLNVTDMTPTEGIKWFTLHELNASGQPVSTKDRRYRVQVYLSPSNADPVRASVRAATPQEALRGVTGMHGVPLSVSTTDLGPFLVHEDTPTGYKFAIGKQTYVFDEEDTPVTPIRDRPRVDPLEEFEAEQAAAEAALYDDDVPWDISDHYTARVAATPKVTVIDRRTRDYSTGYTTPHYDGWYGSWSKWDRKKDFIEKFNKMEEA